MATRIILIRHGQTDWNLENRYQGHADTGLNRKGVRQAKRLSIRMRREDVDRVYSSDRRRAMDFAKIIFPMHKVKVEPDLREISFGIFEGLTYDEIKNKYPGVYSRWADKPFDIKIPKGEAPALFRKRVVRSFKKIARSGEGKTVAIVTHGGSINVIVNKVMGRQDSLDFIPKSASISIIEFKRGKGSVVLLNDTAHLSRPLSYSGGIPPGIGKRREWAGKDG